MPFRRFLLAACALVLVACEPAPDARPRPFADGSAWNRSLPAGAYTHPDPSSATWVGYLARTAPVADVVEYGVPVFEANSSTRRVTVRCTASWCADNGRTVPMPSGAHPSTGSDAAMSVWDRDAQVAYDFWRVSGITSTTVTSSDASHTCTANGNSACDGNGVSTTGSGVSRLAGVVRPGDLSGGVNHAVVFSSRAVNGGCNYRYPASKTDACGQSGGPANPIPEGTVFQLDPAVDVDAYTSDPASRVVLHAMQSWGAVVIDSGGTDAAFIFSDDTRIADYQRLAVPWSRVRALRNWQGT